MCGSGTALGSGPGPEETVVQQSGFEVYRCDGRRRERRRARGDMATVTVIVTTYNRPDALAAVLEGFRVQDNRDFEMVIADDGSTEDTGKLILGLMTHMPFPIRHVWQEDRGFRAAAVRNRTVAASQGDYLIFVDGDCIPFPDFVGGHRALAEPGWFVAGNRILMSRLFTDRVLREKIPVHLWGSLKWSFARVRGWINRFVPIIRLPDGRYRKLNATQWQGAKTCNLAVWRHDLIKVNGFDERYQGWGHEDADLVVRLIRAGVRRKEARFAAPVLHLWHPQIDRRRVSENVSMLKDILASDRTVAENGLEQYLR